MFAEYDAVGRLTKAKYAQFSEEEFEYNSLGNMILRTFDDGSGSGAVTTDYEYETTQLHQLDDFGAVDVEHDGNGDRWKKGSTEYDYSTSDELVQVRDGTTPVLKSYFDEGGQRVARYDVTRDDLTHYFGAQFEYEIDPTTHAVQLVRHFYLGRSRVASDRITAPDGLLTVGGHISSARNRTLAQRWQPRVDRLTLRSSARVMCWTLLGGAGLIVFGVLLLGPSGTGRIAGLTLGFYLLGVIPLPVFGPREADAQVAVNDLVFYHKDHLGSPLAITKGRSTGTIVERIRYRAYGELRGIYTQFGIPKDRDEDSDTDLYDLSTNYGYTGYVPDAASGLLYAGARFYDPQLSLFNTHDPARQFTSPYTYVGFDPVNAVDPDGRLEVLTVVGIIALLTAAATFVDTLVRTGDFGAALSGAVIAGVSAFVLGGVLGQIAQSAVVAKTMDTFLAKAIVGALGGLGAYHSFEAGNVATGLLAIGLTVWGVTSEPSVADETQNLGSRPATTVTTAQGYEVTNSEIDVALKGLEENARNIGYEGLPRSRVFRSSALTDDAFAKTHNWFGYKFVTINPEATTSRAQLAGSLYHEAYHFNSPTLELSDVEHFRLHAYDQIVTDFYGSPEFSVLRFPLTTAGRLDLGVPAHLYAPSGLPREQIIK